MIFDFLKSEGSEENKGVSILIYILFQAYVMKISKTLTTLAYPPLSARIWVAYVYKFFTNFVFWSWKDSFGGQIYIHNEPVNSFEKFTKKSL